MSIEEPFPGERLSDKSFASLVDCLCTHPGMFIGSVSLDGVVAYLCGYDAGRGGAPLLGFHEWLVVKVNTGNNCHWSYLIQLAYPGPARFTSDKEANDYWIPVVGKAIGEYLDYREQNGITKVYYDYGKWLLRRSWYQGPLRLKEDEVPEARQSAGKKRNKR